MDTSRQARKVQNINTKRAVDVRDVLGSPPESPSASALDRLLLGNANDRPRHEDPVRVLRSRQMAEYEKICCELRLTHNTAIRQLFSMPEKAKRRETKICSCGYVFASAAARVCRMCGNDCQAGDDEEADLLTADGSQGTPHAYDFSRFYLGDKQFRPLGAALSIDRQLLSLAVPNT